MNPMIQPNYPSQPLTDCEPLCWFCDDTLSFRKVGGDIKVSCQCGHDHADIDAERFAKAKEYRYLLR